MSMMQRHPFRNFFSAPFDVDWEESWRQATIPEDGAIIVRRELVERRYKVKHEADGTIKYVPIPVDVIEDPKNYGGTDPE